MSANTFIIFWEILKPAANLSVLCGRNQKISNARVSKPNIIDGQIYVLTKVENLLKLRWFSVTSHRESNSGNSNCSFIPTISHRITTRRNDSKVCS